MYMYVYSLVPRPLDELLHFQCYTRENGIEDVHVGVAWGRDYMCTGIDAFKLLIHNHFRGV
jgi:hypothetical protein